MTATKKNTNIDDEIEVMSTEIKNSNDTKLITVSVSEFEQKILEQSMYDFQNKDHLYSKFLGQNEVGTTTTTTQELNSLANMPQNHLEKIKRINSIVKTYINKDDLTGRVYEVLENNVNIQTKKNFSKIPTGRNKKVLKDKAETLLNLFDEKIDLEKLIRRCVSTTYSEGNFITYLRESNNGGYGIEIYPLGIVEVSELEIDGEPMLLFNVDELKSRLATSYGVIKSMKVKNKLAKTIEEDIKRNYPPEVYEAYLKKDKYAFLNPERASIVRINNLNGLYGVSPIFKSLPSQLMLETIDNTDKKNTIDKGKKFVVQILRKELLEKEGSQHFGEMAYAHTNLLEALSKETVVATCPAYVEKIELIESKVQSTNIDTITYYRNKVLNSLGISYLSNESKSSFNAVSINAGELLKTINKITCQLEKVLNKYYQLICINNAIPLEFCPTIKIIDSELLDLESKLKVADLLYSKIGASYKSVFELLDIDCDTEVQRRVQENEYEDAQGNKGFDNIFIPHGSSYTSDSNDLLNNNNNNKQTEENQNQDKDKQIVDKQINDNKID